MLLKEESLSRKFITKGAWMYFFVILGAPIGYITTILLTGNLSKADWGVFSTVMLILSVIGIFSDFGLTESLNYFLPKYILKNDYARVKYLLKFVFVNQMITSTIVSTGLYFSATLIEQYIFPAAGLAQVLQVMVLYFFGVHTLQVIGAFFSSIQNTKIQKMIDFYRVFFTMIGIALLVFTERESLINFCFIWIGSIYLTGCIAASIFYYGYYRQHFSLPEHRDIELRHSFLRYSFGTLLSANVGTLLHLVDSLFLAYFLSVVDAGEYKVYLSLVGIPFIFLSPILGFLYPVISEIDGGDDKSKIYTIFRIFSTYLGVLMLWITGFFLMTGEEIAGLLFGPEYLSSGIALYFIAPFLVLNVLIQINFQILGGLGKVKKRIIILSWTLLVNVILTLMCILGFKYGYIDFPSGSAAASCAVGMSWICMWYLSLRAIGGYARGFDWRFFARNLVIVGILASTFILLTGNQDLSLGLSGRWTYFPTISLAIGVSLVIFLIVNFSHLRTFLETIRRVRNGTL